MSSSLSSTKKYGEQHSSTTLLNNSNGVNSSSSSSSSASLTEDQQLSLSSNSNKPDSSVLSYKGQQLKVEDLRTALEANKEIRELDLRSTVIARNAKPGDILACIKKQAPNLERLYLGNTTWMPQVWAEGSGVDMELYLSVLQVAVFPLADSEQKKTSFSEMLLWVEEVLDAPVASRQKAFFLFFQVFPQIERIDCRDPAKPVPQGGFFSAAPPVVEKKGIQDSDLEAMLKAIPRNFRQLILNLSSCAELTAKALGILYRNKAKLAAVELLGNGWLREVVIADFKALGTLVFVGDREKKEVNGQEFFRWIDSYPRSAGTQETIKAFFAAHPAIASLDLSRSKVNLEQFSCIIDQVKGNLTHIDLSHTEHLGSLVLSHLLKCTKLETLIVSHNNWMRHFWALVASEQTRLKPVLLKIDYSLKTAGTATFSEISGWSKLLKAERQDFSKACALFFAKFSSIKVLNCSFSAMTADELDEILEAWPEGKAQNEWTGELSLVGVAGCNERMFALVHQRVRNLKALYVDEVDGVLLSAPIRKLPPVTGIPILLSLSLQSGPEKTGELSFEMLEKWVWLTEKFQSGTKFEIFNWAVDQFFLKYSFTPIQKLNFSNSLITDNELEKVLSKYRNKRTNDAFSLSVEGCRNLTKAAFPIIKALCHKEGWKILSGLSISEGSHLSQGITSEAMDHFWDILTFNLTSEIGEGKVLYSDLLRWHTLMGTDADWQVSCERFFKRFSDVKELDLEGKPVEEEKLTQLFTKWGAHLNGKQTSISLNLSSSSLLTSAILGKIYRILGTWVEKINLSDNGWVVDQGLAELLQLPKLTQVEIKGCKGLSDEMVGACETVVGPKGTIRLTTVSFADLEPLLKGKEAEAACTRYFLHHPVIEKIDLSSTSIDDEQLALILRAWQGARLRWQTHQWSQLILDEPNRTWTPPAKECSLVLSRCKELSSICFSALQENCTGIRFINLSENQWVVNAGLELIEEKKLPIEVNVYGCRNITQDVEGRLPSISLLQPRWTTPVTEEATITFPQVAHHSCALRPLKQRAEAVANLFNSFYADIWPSVAPLTQNGEVSSTTLSVLDWGSRIGELLPHRREAIGSLIGKDPAKLVSLEEVKEARGTVAKGISLILTEALEVGVPQVPLDELESRKKPAGIDSQTLINKFSVKDAKEDLSAFFLKLEKAVEASFFLLDLIENEPLSPVTQARDISSVTQSEPIDIAKSRKEIEKLILIAYTSLFPKDRWELAPAFVYRAVGPLAIPSVLPNPANKDERITLAKWMAEEGFDACPARRGELIDRWLRNWTGKVVVLADKLENVWKLEEVVTEGNRFRKVLKEETSTSRQKELIEEWLNSKKAETDFSKEALREVSIELEPLKIVDAWQKERFIQLLGNRDPALALLTEQDYATVQKKIQEEWQLEWSMWTQGYGDPLTPPKRESECEVVQQNIEQTVAKQREFLYSFAVSEQIMRSFPFANKIDLGKGGITLWQLEGILKSLVERGGDKKIDLVNLSYNPLLSAEGIRDVMGSFASSPQINQLGLDGNLWVNDRLVRELDPYADRISLDRCVNYVPLKGSCKNAFLEEEYVQVNNSSTGAVIMSDEKMIPQSFHITTIRSLLASSGELEHRYRTAIMGQAYLPTKISCTDSDVIDEEISFLTMALNEKLRAINGDPIDFDLSGCSKLTPNCFQALGSLRDRLSTLDLSRNLWVGGKGALSGLVSHTKGLRELYLIDCPNLFLPEIEGFVVAFFIQREEEILHDLGLSLKLIDPNQKVDFSAAPTEKREELQRNLALFESQRKSLSIAVATVKANGSPVLVTLHKGEKYADKFHNAILKVRGSEKTAI